MSQRLIPPLITARWMLLALLLWQGVWHLWLHPPMQLPLAFVLTLSVLPMALALTIGWSLQRNGLVLAGCVLLAFFTHAVTEAYTVPSLRTVAGVQIALIVVYFAALLNLRRKRRPS